MSDLRTIITLLKDRENIQAEELLAEENQRIQSNLAALKETLNKEQKKLLLRITDDKDLIIEKTAQECFTDGFYTAVRIMVEALSVK